MKLVSVSLLYHVDDRSPLELIIFMARNGMLPLFWRSMVNFSDVCKLFISFNFASIQHVLISQKKSSMYLKYNFASLLIWGSYFDSHPFAKWGAGGLPIAKASTCLYSGGCYRQKSRLTANDEEITKIATDDLYDVKSQEKNGNENLHVINPLQGVKIHNGGFHSAEIMTQQKIFPNIVMLYIRSKISMRTKNSITLNAQNHQEKCY